MGKSYWGAIALLTASLGVAAAEESVQVHETIETSGAYISAQPFAVVQDRDRAIWDDDGLGARFLYGKVLNGNWFWEGQFAYNNLETGIGGYTDYYQAHLGLDLAYRFGDQQGFTPFLLLGMGAVHDDIYFLDNSRPTEDETSFFANAGFGFSSGELGNSGVRIRAEARYVHSEFADGFDDVHVGLGFEMPLGRHKVVTRTVVKEVIKEVVKPVPVQTAPADSDKDGVVDGVDRCPNTLQGAKVDQYGCVLKEQTVKLEGVHFESGSAELTTASLYNLREIASFLRDQPDVRVEIAGHTDSQGGAEFNQRLSQDRAFAVKTFLQRQGIAANRLTARGYGEFQPLVNNDTAGGRAMNRRVEFRIQK